MAKKWMVPLASVAVVLLLVAWAGGVFEPSPYSEDPDVAELQRMREELVQRDERPDEQTRDDFRQRIGNLSAEQRREFFTSGLPAGFTGMIERRMDEFFALPPEEQQKKLDAEIDRMEQWRGQGGGGPPWARGGDMTEQQRDEMRKRMLDNTTPELRSKFERRMRMINDRRQERGLEPIGPGRAR